MSCLEILAAFTITTFPLLLSLGGALGLSIGIWLFRTVGGTGDFYADKGIQIIISFSVVALVIGVLLLFGALPS